MIRVVIFPMDRVRRARCIRNLFRQIWINRNLPVRKDWSISLVELFEQIQVIFEMINHRSIQQILRFNVELFVQPSPMENLHRLRKYSGKLNSERDFYERISSVRWKSPSLVGKPNRSSIGCTELVLDNMQMNVERIIKMVCNY